jgi:hypothetical protein
MPRFDSLCTACGFEEPIIVAGGTHPPCSQCGGHTEYIWRSNPASIQTDEAFIGGQTIENLGHEPVTVYSRTELKEAMAKAGVEQKIKYVPGDKYLTNWAMGIDAQTLANAAVLVTRQGSGYKESDPAALRSFRPSIRTLKPGE